jgi:hypothetical protein
VAKKKKKKTDKPTHAIKLNIDGRTIITVRTDEDAAKNVAASFGLVLDDDNPAVTHWPIVIHKIGEETVLEQQIMSQLLAPKLQVPEGQKMILLVGKSRAPARAGQTEAENDEWYPLDQIIRRVYEITENEEPMDWCLLVADPGTVVPHFVVEDESGDE